MNEDRFRAVFSRLTGNKKGHFPWQWALYQRFASGDFPPSCNLPTGLGKTSVIALWLIALAHAPRKVPRRLVYVVNRRTVVDQSTREAEKLRRNLTPAGLGELLVPLCAVRANPPLAISTLRGQFADNREWSRDPARPAVIVGTVDMIGSRLLFSGYGAGFKTRPLFAGFLGQDVLLVHDEAHLEPAFQALLEAIRAEQDRCGEFARFWVTALTATSRDGEEAWGLTDEEKNPPADLPDPPTEPVHFVWRRLKATKALTLHRVDDEDAVVPRIVELAHRHEGSRAAVLVFVRTVKAVEDVKKGLRARKVPEEQISTLTGTMRGLERNRQADPGNENADPVFARFLKPRQDDETPWAVKQRDGTVYLVCTAAGEVGVDISADHLVCDLTPFDSMTQRFGRVNRFGNGDSCIDVVHEAGPTEKKKDDPFDQRRWATLTLLTELNGDASPDALRKIDASRRQAAFSPAPRTLRPTDILFDAWALTTVRGSLPGRPPVVEYLHGLAEWEPPETHVAWRKEVGLLSDGRFSPDELEDLLDDYPLKPHELLRDRTDRVFDTLKKLAKEYARQPAWVVAEDGSIRVATVSELAEAGKDGLNNRTILFPPIVGGLTREGVLGDGAPSKLLDVADEWQDENGISRRQRVWDDEEAPPGMRLVRVIDTKPEADEEEGGEEGGTLRRFWRWYVRPRSADDDGSETALGIVTWQQHTKDVELAATRMADKLLSGDLHRAVVLAARFHDLGKKRDLWQRGVGNRQYPAEAWGKSDRRPGGFRHDYRHEFGSLLDVAADPEFRKQPDEVKELVLHLVAAHHGYGRPHFPADRAFDPERPQRNAAEVAREVPQRFARLQRRYGRWGLAYLESLLRAADYAASANPSTFMESGS